MTSVLAIIPARGGSKGIPRKNLALCAGRPLVDWTIQAAEESRYITDAILSSDDREILARAAGSRFVRPSIRPAALAADETSTEDVLDYHLRMNSGADVIVLLQPTSPTRHAGYVDAAIERFLDGGFDSLLSVVPSHAFLWDAAGAPMYGERRRRQDFEQYEENGAIYVFSREHWELTRNRLGGRVGTYVMEEIHRVQVDTSYDLAVASMTLQRLWVSLGTAAAS